MQKVDLLLLSGVLVISACGSDASDAKQQGMGGASTPSGRTANAEQLCNRFWNRFCNRFATCEAEIGAIRASDRSLFLEGCSEEIEDECQNAVGVSPTYDRCLSDLQTSSCSALLPDEEVTLPSTCLKVILVDE